MEVPATLNDSTVIQLVSDDGNFSSTQFRSYSVTLGPVISPYLTNGSFNGNNFQFTVVGHQGVTYTVYKADNLSSTYSAADFTSIGTVTIPSGPDPGSAPFVDSTVPTGTFSRLYRVGSATAHSINCLGFARIIGPGGWNFVANQFDNKKGNQVKDVLPTFSDYVTLYKFDDCIDNWVINSYDPVAGWDFPTMTFAPGEGGILLLPSTQTFTFIGEVGLGNLSVGVPDALSIRSSKVPQAANITQLGFQQLVLGDVIFKLAGPANPLTYNSYTNTTSGWSPSIPSFSIGEAFWVNRPQWTREFSVW